MEGVKEAERGVGEKEKMKMCPQGGGVFMRYGNKSWLHISQRFAEVGGWE